MSERRSKIDFRVSEINKQVVESGCTERPERLRLGGWYLSGEVSATHQDRNHKMRADDPGPRRYSLDELV